MLELFSQTLAVTAPVFAMVLLGIALRRLGWIDAAFIATASSLVFRGCMPTLMFLALLKADVHAALQPGVLLYFSFATLAGFALVLAWAHWRVPRADRGVYAQGAFRGNCGIVGLALAIHFYGDFGLALGGVLAALVILLYNTLATIVLATYNPQMQSDWRRIAAGVARNPLIIGIVVAAPFAALDVQLPGWLLTSAEYFADLTLPLALICVGGSLTVAAVSRGSRLAIGASLWKLLWLPALFTALAWALGFRGPELGVLFIYFACPTAAASYVMARAYGGDERLAATIIALTTAASVLTINLGMMLLRALGAV